MYKILESTYIVKRSVTVHRINAIKSFLYKVLKIQIWIILMQSHKKYKASSQRVCNSGTVCHIKSSRSQYRFINFYLRAEENLNDLTLPLKKVPNVFWGSILHTPESQAQHIPVLKCSQDSEFHRKKIIIIVKIIVLITILAKTSLDTSRVFYFYKIRCGILLHSIKCMTYHMDCSFSYNRKWLCAHTVKSYLGILLTDTFKCLC